MPAYLTPEWFSAADAALRADATLRTASLNSTLILQQTVRSDDDTITWHIRFENGSVSLHVGAAENPTVAFSCDRSIADAIHIGLISAQAAFMSGNLQLGGDVSALISNGELFAGLGDALAALR
ncbi:SCP2 sterol-binding domain containing protein [Acidimicrobiia bacterium]